MSVFVNVKLLHLVEILLLAAVQAFWEVLLYNLTKLTREHPIRRNAPILEALLTPANIFLNPIK